MKTLLTLLAASLMTLTACGGGGEDDCTPPSVRGYDGLCKEPIMGGGKG